MQRTPANDFKKPLSTPRRLGDFKFLPLDTKGMSGACADRGELFKATKKVKAGDDPTKEKYKAVHFLKKISSDGRANPAVVEVSAQEFLRLMIPGQPKGRVILGEQGNTYVQSKAIPNAKTLWSLGTNQEEKMLDMKNYGTEKGFKGLGQLNFFVAWVLDDPDYKSHNVMADPAGRLYKIDGGRSYAGGGRGSPYMKYDYDTSDYAASLEKNLVYQREMHSAVLTFIALPYELIEKFITICDISKYPTVPDRIRETHAGFLKSAVEERKETEMRFPNFYAYCLSKTAAEDLREYKAYLATFAVKGKNLLLNYHPSALQEIDTFFLNFREAAQQEIPAPALVKALVKELPPVKRPALKPKKVSPEEKLKSRLKELFSLYTAEGIIKTLADFELALLPLVGDESDGASQIKAKAIQQHIKSFKKAIIAEDEKKGSAVLTDPRYWKRIDNILSAIQEQLIPPAPKIKQPHRQWNKTKAAFGLLLGALAAALLAAKMGAVGLTLAGFVISGGVVGLISYAFYNHCHSYRPSPAVFFKPPPFQALGLPDGAGGAFVDKVGLAMKSVRSHP